MSKNIFSEPLFVENFNFSPVANLYNVADWTGTDILNRAKVSVTPGSLNYTGYIGNGLGNKARTVLKYPGAIYSNIFESCDTGTVYASYLIRVDSLPASASEGYIVFLDESSGSTNHTCKVILKRLSSTTFNLGIRKKSGTINYSPAVYSTNTVYLLVSSYNFKPGNGDDIVKLFVNTSGVPATEPASPLAADPTGNDDYDIGELGINTSFLDSNLNGLAFSIDNIRVGRTWSSIFTENISYSLILDSFIQGFYNPGTFKMNKDTITVLLRDTVSPYQICDSTRALLDSTGSGNFIFRKASKGYPYFIVFKHRNSIETWSKFGKKIYSLYNYSFSSGTGSALGDNLVKVGTKYCFYGGDVNQSGNVNLADMSNVYNAAATFTSGYKINDITGDNAVNLTDLTLVYNNSVSFVTLITQ